MTTDALAQQLDLIPLEGGRPLEMRFPERLVKEMLARHSDRELTRVFLNRLKAMGAVAVVVSTDPLSDERVFKIEWPETINGPA